MPHLKGFRSKSSDVPLSSIIAGVHDSINKRSTRWTSSTLFLGALKSVSILFFIVCYSRTKNLVLEESSGITALNHFVEIRNSIHP